MIYNNTQKFILGIVLGFATFYLGNKIIYRSKKQTKSISQLPKSQQTLKQLQLIKSIQYFGRQNHNNFEKSYVVIFGVGGVGSHVVNILARSGIKKIRIIDFDLVSLSSLNRHAFALREDVGTSKVNCIKKYIKNIFPNTQIQTIQQYVTKQNIDSLLPLDADYIIDCIDNIEAKVELVSRCVKNNLKIIVSGGAGLKNDTTKIQVRDISECKYDQLISALKKKLSKLGIKKNVKVIFSYQQSEKQMLPLNQQQEKDPQSFKVFDNYRIRIIPVLGTMPASIGISIASYVMTDLMNKKYTPYELEDIKSSLYAKIYSNLINDEKNMGIQSDQLNFDFQDVYILMRHIFEWTCFLSGKKNVKFLFLARWNASENANLFNLVALCKQQYEIHITYKNLKQAGYKESIHEKMKLKWDLIEKIKKQKLIVYK